MLNRTPPNKPSTSNVIQSYRKRRMQRGPMLLYGAIGLVVIGLILLVVWLMGPNKPLGAMFATETPTATVTSTPTSTNTPTPTSTVTETATITLTPTPSENFSTTSSRKATPCLPLPSGSILDLTASCSSWITTRT